MACDGEGRKSWKVPFFNSISEFIHGSKLFFTFQFIGYGFFSSSRFVRYSLAHHFLLPHSASKYNNRCFGLQYVAGHGQKYVYVSARAYTRSVGNVFLRFSLCPGA